MGAAAPARAALCSAGQKSPLHARALLSLARQKEGGAKLGRTCLSRTARGRHWRMSSKCVSSHTWLKLFQSAVGCVTDCGTGGTRSHPLQADAALPVQGELSCSSAGAGEIHRDLPTPESPQGLLRNPLSLECLWNKAPSSN